jgi:outer membrane protein OmpA-like peptidoglycan-associated protein
MALAEPPEPTGGFYGGYLFTPGSNPLGPAPELMARIGVRAIPVFDLELEIGWAQGHTRSEFGYLYQLWNPRLAALYHISPDSRADLFLSVGVGVQVVRVFRDSSETQPGANDEGLYENPSNDFLMHAGPSLTIQLAGPWHLRGDVRWFGTFGNNPTEEVTDVFQNMEITVGFDFRPELPPDIDGDGFKNKLDGCPEDPEDFDEYKDEDGCPDEDNDKDGIKDETDECPMEKEDFDDFEDDDGCPDEDNDRDGFSDKKDACPNKAEDFDGFEDDDGCPDGDNDGDGISDRKDACPDRPEDFDGFEDEDGCPDNDNDGDGITDKKDLCPEHPEDKDGFEDEDGCPDKDNDDDRIPDSRDSCPNEPEVYNQIDDTDGCPDETPPEIKKFTGVIRGITFETGKAVIRPSSDRILTEALMLFTQYPELRLEIQGHTDDRGNDSANLALSQARAEAVRLWFIQHGVSPDRIVAVGYGETVPIADNGTDAGRAENRRVEFRILF